MTIKERLDRARQAQVLYAAGADRKEIATALGMSLKWAYNNTGDKAPQEETKPTDRKRQTPDEIRETCIQGIYFAKIAVRLGCEPTKALDAVASAGLVRIGGVAV